MEFLRPTVINVLKNQFETLKAVDSGTMNDKSKSLKKSPLAELEVFDTLYVFLCTSYLVTPLDLVTVF